MNNILKKDLSQLEQYLKKYLTTKKALRLSRKANTKPLRTVQEVINHIAKAAKLGFTNANFDVSIDAIGDVVTSLQFRGFTVFCEKFSTYEDKVNLEIEWWKDES